MSIAALLLGPLIYAAGRKNRVAKRIFDLSIVVAIGIIIFVHIIPDAIDQGGYWAWLVLAVGVVFPLLLERLFRSAADAAHMVIVVLAVIGLSLHAIIDGLALLPENGTGLAHAIILHRLPVGMAIWWAVRPNLGTMIAVSVFVLVILATTIGYLVGDTVLEVTEARTLAMLQAFVSGSLVHIVIFGVKHDHDH